MAIPPNYDILRRDTEVQLQVEVLEDRIGNDGPAFTQHTTYRILHAWPHNGFAVPAAGTEFCISFMWHEDGPDPAPGEDMPDWTKAGRRWPSMTAGTVREGFFRRDHQNDATGYEVVEDCFSTVNHARAEPWFTMPPPRVPKPVVLAPPVPAQKRLPKTWWERWFGVPS